MPVSDAEGGDLMGMFGALDAASSGATLANTWLDAISDNVANINTVRPAGEEPFRARLVVAQSVPGVGNGPGEGVKVGSIEEKGGDPERVYDPENPLADAQGYITRPQVDLSEEMANMMMATRSYQANLSVIDRVRDAYQRALQIGRS